MTGSRTLPNLAPRWPLGLSLVLSLLLHAGFAFLVSAVFSAPSLEMEFQLPMDVEFGTSEQMALAPAVAGSEQAATSPSEETPSGKESLAVEDAGVPPKPEPKAKPKARADAADGGAGDEASSAPPGAVGQGNENRIPAGAQIAVRVDMSRIRVSPLAEDVRQLLAAIPDWKALLDGSGIDPIEQLDRFMIATPNLQRSKIVVAGRYIGTDQTVPDAVERLAAAHGVSPNWRDQAGVRVANWANADETPRVIALVGPSHFTISRQEDLVRVLAFAATRKDAHKKKRPPLPDAHEIHPADALLSMEDDEGLSIEVEGAEQFVRRAARGIPTKLRLSAVEKAGANVELRGHLFFSDASKAAEGASFWDNLRNAYSRNALVAMLGLAQPLKDGTIQQNDTEVLLTVGLSLEQTRLILGYLRELVRPVPPSTNVTPATPPVPTP